MEDYEQLDRTERLCGAVPEERGDGAAMFVAGLIAATPWLAIAIVGGLATLAFGIMFGR